MLGEAPAPMVKEFVGLTSIRKLPLELFVVLMPATTAVAEVVTVPTVIPAELELT